MKRLILAAFLLACGAAMAKAEEPSAEERIATHPWYAPLLIQTHERAYRAAKQAVGAVSEQVGQIVAHPAGCPGRAFCGCGASIRVFGHSRRELWLARNWYRFPRAHAASGMVAVRNHHVMVIEQVYGDGTALVYDANSGGHRTRIHRRSLTGYAIVNPRA